VQRLLLAGDLDHIRRASKARAAPPIRADLSRREFRLSLSSRAVHASLSQAPSRHAACVHAQAASDTDTLLYGFRLQLLAESEAPAGQARTQGGNAIEGFAFRLARGPRQVLRRRHFAANLTVTGFDEPTEPAFSTPPELPESPSGLDGRAVSLTRAPASLPVDSRGGPGRG
jgi:hypothetical protein